MLTFAQALEQLLAAAQSVEEVRHVPLTAAVGRVLAHPLYSTVSVPPLDNSAMDGYAVRSAEITAAGITLPVSQRIPAGTVGQALQVGTVARIFTGAPIPEGADAVIMQERCEPGQGQVSLMHIPHAGENIRRAGEDIAAGSQIMAAGTRLRAQEVALAASAGLAELPVFRRVRVGVFFTGDELVQPGDPLPPGAIYNSNRYALRSLLEGLGCEVRDLGAVADSLAATRDALRRAAAENDLVITSGGVSVGEEDHVKPAVEAEGQLDMWKIAIKPGKPLAFGRINKPAGEGAAWFLGLPGNPVAAFATFLMLVRPFILRLQGMDQVTPIVLPLRSASSWNKPDKVREEFLRGRINPMGEFELYPNQGSAVVTSLCWSDGLIINPPGVCIAPGDAVRFVSFAELLA